jgi:hypothetical protein
VSSQPDAWRVRVDERGWGVLDTTGVLPKEDGRFILRFAARGCTVPFPRVWVVADGSDQVGAAVAGDSDIARAHSAAAQHLFDGSGGEYDVLPDVSGLPQVVLGLTVALGVALGGMVTWGCVVAWRSAPGAA